MENVKKLQEIASNYRVLYIEDDKNIANLLINYLSNFFREIVYAEDGKEALSLYEKGSFELIITDIQMPHLNGLDFTYEVKQMDREQHIIVTSAFSDLDKLMSSIKLGIEGYLIKPINYTDMNNLLLKVVTNIKRDKDLVVSQNNLALALDQVSNKNQQLNQYIDILDNISIVSKTDVNGKITYVNSYFCDVSGYTQEEIIGNTYEIIRHPDMPKSVYVDLYNTLKNGDYWKGTLKNRNKDNSAYFVYITILPIYDNSKTLKEYMGIGFLTTKEEMEKREFRKRVMTSYQEYRKNTKLYDQQVANLEEQVKNLLRDQKYIQDYNLKLEEKSSRLLSQVEYYEKEYQKIDDYRQKTIDRIDDRINKLEESNKQLKSKVQTKEQELAFLKKDYDEKRNKLKDLSSHNETQKNLIIDLRSTIKEISEKEE